MRSNQPRSYCPINLSLEIFGDAWTLLVLRDMMFSGKRHFGEFLQSDEHISSNILADRLARLVEHGLLTRSDDPTHKQKAIYSLTETGIALLPVLVQMGIWGSKHRPASPELARFSASLEKGGPTLWAELAAELRRIHLGAPATDKPTRRRRPT